jgi:hypothetical protein
MASSRGSGSGILNKRCANLIFFKLLLMLTMFLAVQGRVMPVTPAAAPSTASAVKKNDTLVFYQQEKFGTTDDSNIRVITSSTLGALYVIDMPCTETVNASSTSVGRRYGATTATSGTAFTFQLSDYHIEWPAKNLNGTFLLEGAIDSMQTVRELKITGGTGSFYLARGHAYARTISFNQSDSSTVTQIEAHFDFSCKTL